MSTVTVHSLSEFVQCVSELNAGCVRNGADLHEELLFRGQSDTAYELMPSLGRGRKFTCEKSIFDEERNLIELAKYKLPDVFQNSLQPVELLALLQHHGIPTRMLDVTESALVALYFACCSNGKKDGEVVAFKHDQRDVTNYPVVNAIADSYRFARGSFCSLSSFYGEVVLQPYFLEFKHTNKMYDMTDKQGGKWIEECCKDLLFVYAPNRSLRQRLQRGRYILFPNHISPCVETDDSWFEARIDPVPKDHPSIAEIITIPKEKKKKLLSDLSVMGISKETLFADSIDKVCESIKEDCTYRVKAGSIQEDADL